MKHYHLQPSLWLLKDEASTNFHVKKDDYFGTMAAILTLIKEKINSTEITDRRLIKQSLENLIQDLIFLQKNYSIIERVLKIQKSKKKIIKKKNNN